MKRFGCFIQYIVSFVKNLINNSIFYYDNIVSIMQYKKLNYLDGLLIIDIHNIFISFIIILIIITILFIECMFTEPRRLYFS